jgi:hypothetical protein
MSLNISPEQVAQVLSTTFNGVRVTSEWVTDPTTSYGYKPVLIIRTDGTHNILSTRHGSAVLKLGFQEDSTSIGNNSKNTTYNSDYTSEYRSLINETADLASELSALTNIFNTADRLDRSTSDALIIYNACKDESSQIPSEITSLNTEMTALSTILQETTLPSYGEASTAYSDASQFLPDCTYALIQDQNTITAMDNYGFVGWMLDLKTDSSNLLNVSDSSFVLRTDSGYDRRFLDAILAYDYRIKIEYIVPYGSYPFYQYVELPSDGTWEGFSVPTGNRYSTSNEITYHINTSNSNWMILNVTDAATHTYSVDKTSITVDGTYFDFFTYYTLGSLKTAVDGAYGIDVTGNTAYDPYATGCLISGNSFTEDATIFPGIRGVLGLMLPFPPSPTKVLYYTIDDQFITDRSSFDASRKINVDNRISFLEDRENQIRQTVLDEEYFMTTDASSGNLYVWADNRFNRSNGCEAKLKQITKQIEMSNSSLDVNRRFF